MSATSVTVRSLRTLAAICFVSAVLGVASHTASGQSDVAASARSAAPWIPEGVTPQCLFLPQTAVPMLAMGIRRIDDAPELQQRRLLDLWERPGVTEGAEPFKRVPLFRPHFVYDRRAVDGITWHLLGSKYAGEPLGWADGRQLLVLESRYGYHFDNPKRVPPGVQLYGSREAAYKALEVQSRVPPETPLDDVVVAERLKADSWNLLAEDAIPPFIELGEEQDLKGSLAAGLTDTTLTFPFPGENQLIRLGAVAGGPVDTAEITAKIKKTQERAGIAIVFVIDETLSMQKFFGGVADFIESNLDLEQKDVNVRVAVSWYSDIEKPGDIPYEVHPLQPLTGPGMDASAVQELGKRIVKTVRDHKEKIVRGWGKQAEELIYPGLVAAIEAASFEKGENAMVFVIGDAADRYGLKENQDLVLQKTFEDLQTQLRRLIDEHGLQLAFVEVGEHVSSGTAEDGEVKVSFTDQAREFRKGMPAETQGRVLVQGPGSEKLQNRIADLQAQMDRQRTILLEEIQEMKSRNSYSEPGAALLTQFRAKGIDREAFDKAHLQFFFPAWGWRYHPQQFEATPQLRELVFLAKPESDALIPALEAAANDLERQGRIEVDAVRKKFAEVLVKKTGHTGVVQVIDKVWQGLPEGDRTFGRFLVQGMGLRVRNPLLFHRGVANPQAGPTRESVQLMRSSRNQINNSRQGGGIWEDAWKVLP